MVHTPDDFDIPSGPEQDEYGVPLDASPEDFGFAPSSPAPGQPPPGPSLPVYSEHPQKNGQRNKRGYSRQSGRGNYGGNTEQLLETLSQRATHAPPHSIEAEQAVLGVLMLEANEAFDKVSEVVTEGDFYQYSHKLIYRAISTLAVEGRHPDVVTVTGWLQTHGELEDSGGLNYIGALVEVAPSAGNIKEYADIVRERSVLRQLISVANEIADSAYDSNGRTAKELLDAAETKVFAIADQTAKSGGGFHDIKSVLSTAIERINLLFESDAAITGLSTGFTELDEKTSGLQKSDLIIVAGRPSMGKTTFAMNIAENAAMEADAPVAIFSMEMPADQLGMRMISSLGRVELQKLRTGKLAEQDWPRITSAITLLNQKRNVYIDDSPGLTPTELRARSRRLAREHGLSLIVIDYLQLMQVSDSRENRATEISEISRSLKALAKELQVPVIALSQLNRSLEQRPDKRPVMSDLRESGAIEQDADVIMFIYRDEVYNPEDEANKGRAEILIRKQRNGPIGAVNLTFLGRYTRFENFSPEIMTGEFS
ncbi:MAG: replicative DNA helicase [Granulosicoccus sp.]